VYSREVRRYPYVEKTRRPLRPGVQSRGQKISIHRSRPVERRLERVQHGDIHLAGLARLLDEDGAEEEENVEAVVLRSWLQDHADRLPHVLQSERNSSHTRATNESLIAAVVANLQDCYEQAGLHTQSQRQTDRQTDRRTGEYASHGLLRCLQFSRSTGIDLLFPFFPIPVQVPNATRFHS